MIKSAITTVEPRSSYTSTERSQSVSATHDQETAVGTTPKPDKANEPPVAAQAEIPEQEKELRQKVAEAIPKVRELMQKNQRSLDFKVAERDNRVIITVIDKETDRVIRQIPPEDLIGIAEAYEQGVQQGLGGLIFNSRA